MRPSKHTVNALSAALRRRRRNEEAIAERNAKIEKYDDWQGRCRFCRRMLKGTLAQIRAHRCPEYEASLEAAV